MFKNNKKKSKRILEEIKLLLKSLGIETCKIGETQTKCHRFVIRTAFFAEFYDLIKFEHLKKKKRLEALIEKIKSKPIPIKYKVLDLLQKTYPLTSYMIESQLGLRRESVIEAVCSLYEEGKISKEYVSSRKPRLWYPKGLYVE